MAIAPGLRFKIRIRVKNEDEVKVKDVSFGAICCLPFAPCFRITYFSPQSLLFSLILIILQIEYMKQEISNSRSAS